MHRAKGDRLVRAGVLPVYENATDYSISILLKSEYLTILMKWHIKITMMLVSADAPGVLQFC